VAQHVFGLAAFLAYLSLNFIMLWYYYIVAIFRTL